MDLNKKSKRKILFTFIVQNLNIKSRNTIAGFTRLCCFFVFLPFHLSRISAKTTAATQKRAFVSLIVGTDKSQKQYASALVMWAANLQHFNVSDDIIVMVTSEVQPSIIDTMASMGVVIKHVPRLTSTQTSAQYEPMLSKLALWKR